jgi:hypothetical protein
MNRLTVFGRIASIVLFVVGTAFAAQAQSLSGREVMDKVYHAPKPKTTIATISMIISKNGKTLTRTMTIWKMGDNARGEVEKKVVKFLAPGDIKGAGFLSTKKVDGSTESRLWLPAMGKVRRLSSGPSDQDQAFFGSDFSNRDISDFIEADFSYEVKDFRDNTYIVEANPKKALGYDRLVYEIDAKEFIKKKIDYYRAGKVVKSQSIAYASIQDYSMQSVLVMTAASGSSTELKCSDYKIDQEFGDQTFTERFLKQ